MGRLLPLAGLLLYAAMVTGSRTGALPPPAVNIEVAKKHVCPELTCMNGGTMDLMSCSCSCPAPWKGRSCRTCSLECGVSGELNSAECSCVCKKGFSGKHCDKRTGGEQPKTEDALENTSMSMFVIPQKTNPPESADPSVKELWSALRGAAAGSPIDNKGLTPHELELDELSSASLASEDIAQRTVSSHLLQTASRAASASKACRNWRYQVCKVQEVEENIGEGDVAVGEGDMCTHWHRASETLKILGLRPGLDEDKYNIHEVLINHDEARNITAGGNDNGQPNPVKVGATFNYRICFLRESVAEALPDAAAGTAPVVPLTCTKLSPRPHLAIYMVSKIFKQTFDEMAKNGQKVQEVAANATMDLAEEGYFGHGNGGGNNFSFDFDDEDDEDDYDAVWDDDGGDGWDGW